MIARRNQTAWTLLFVVLIAGATYANTVGNGFVMDDAYTVVQNTRIRSWSNLPRLFTQAWGADAATTNDRLINQTYYRPLVGVSYMVDFALWGPRPLGFHLTNTLIHALICALLVLLLVRLGLSAFAAGAGALVFALHPIHTEAVNVISYRTELLATLFVVAGLLLHVAAGPRHRRDLLWLPLFYALGLCSKESAIIFPAWLLVLDSARAPSRRHFATFLSRSACTIYLPLLLVALLYLLLRQHLLTRGAITFFGNLDTGLIFLSVMKIYLLYLKLLLVPWPLAPFWDWSMLPPAHSWLDYQALLGLLALVATGILMVLLWRKAAPAQVGHSEAPLAQVSEVPQDPPEGAPASDAKLSWQTTPHPEQVCLGARCAALGLAWWLLGLLVYAHLIPLPVGAAERFLYLPSVGWTLVVAALVAFLGQRYFVQRRWWISLGLGYLFVLGFLTVQRNEDWASDLRLQQRTCQHFPGSFNAHYTLGKLYQERKHLDQAIAEYRQANQIIPHLSVTVERLGHALITSGRAAEAAQLLEQTFAAGTRTPQLEALYKIVQKKRLPQP